MRRRSGDKFLPDHEGVSGSRRRRTNPPVTSSSEDVSSGLILLTTYATTSMSMVAMDETNEDNHHYYISRSNDNICFIKSSACGGRITASGDDIKYYRNRPQGIGGDGISVQDSSPDSVAGSSRLICSNEQMSPVGSGANTIRSGFRAFDEDHTRTEPYDLIAPDFIS
uniref:Uncharacterized protein n=1 Tax=Mesocestoides corti TaxID=53468 RepID=A0A5K3F1V9_MESCO